MKQMNHTGGNGLFLIGLVFYIGALILFATQTWSLVNWLFPSDNFQVKLLTVLSFDVMSIFWSCVDLFYRFASRTAHNLVRWAWAVTFLLSFVASVLNMCLEWMFRYQTTSDSLVKEGYGISIFAVTINILFLTFFFYLEWKIRHPLNYEYDIISAPVEAVTDALPNTSKKKLDVPKRKGREEEETPTQPNTVATSNG